MAENHRREGNVKALNAMILSNPTLSNMILHGQGLQKLAECLAQAGQTWFDEVVLTNDGNEPRLGFRDVDNFHQYLSLEYPRPHRVIETPDMDDLADIIVNSMS